MSYVALENIGDYKEGEVVPDAEAEVWLNMYKVAPVELQDSKGEPEEDEYQAELLALQGIGAKTVKDIVSIFPTREELITAVQGEESIALRDDVVELLKEHFGE